MNKYGAEHRDAKRQKLASMEEHACEVTGEQDNLEGHHNVPKMFFGPDIKNNYLILTRDFHAYLHAICNIKDNEQVFRRLHLTKKIWNDPNSLSVPHQMEKVEQIDNQLMREYISNMIFKIKDGTREKLMELSLLSSFKTIRDQAIKIRQLEEQIKSLSHKK